MPPKKSTKVKLNIIKDTEQHVELPNLNNDLNLTSIVRSKKDLINGFQILIYKANSDNEKTAVFKVRQYEDVIKILQNYPNNNIESLDDITKWLHENGKKDPKKILSKIKEFLESGEIQEVNDALKDKRVSSVMDLTTVYAIGPSKAIQLYDKHNISTVKELEELFKKDKSVLNDKQAIGLKYHYDLIQRIPRDEIDEYAKVIDTICKRISKNMEWSINGSYRRGHLSSGDIDILISSKDGKEVEYRHQLRCELSRIGIIKEILASGDKKDMCITKINEKGIARHMDLMSTNIDSYPFAVMYFTGSGPWNVLQRNHALKMGYTINEFTIAYKDTKLPVSKDDIKKKIGKTSFQTEKDIYDFLDLEYVLPADRDDIKNLKIKVYITV